MASIRAAIGPAFIAMAAATALAYFIVTPQKPLAQFFAAYHVGFGAMGVALAALLADRLARAFGYNRVVAVALSLSAFWLALPRPQPAGVTQALGDLSSTSIFLGLAVALVSGEFLRICGRRIANRTAAVAAGVVATAVLFGGLAAVHVSIASGLLVAIKPLVRVGDTLPALLIVVLIQMLLWSAGIHGPAFLAGIVTPVYLQAIEQNSQALLHHQAPPHIVTVMTFLFFYPGGSGAALPLAILLSASKRPRLRKLGLASLLPTFANLSEPLIFGVPLVMNPNLLIPFIGTPMVLACITYAAMRFGLVAKTVVYLPSAVPSVIGAWITTLGDWRAVVLVLVNVIVGIACYLPFVRSFENSLPEGRTAGGPPAGMETQARDANQPA
ncbi:MAG: PTS sugar transporter subunit IIC [Candidatus Eremiobacteraeota bacterium]|nr:PTS sugar transporter subunit IIC [Candidatus Eremiobacteraeota bacterium]MBC5828544.1 PTS sugar transporter subunit IIC [Candidatus Eremiobacteraeota bacterium]